MTNGRNRIIAAHSEPEEYILVNASFGKKVPSGVDQSG
jgi:hypothetical protein